MGITLFEKKMVLAFVVGCLAVLLALAAALLFEPARFGASFADYGTYGDYGSYTPDDGGDYRGGCCSSTGGDFSGRGFGDVGRLIERAPQEKRKLLTKVFSELVSEPDEQLYILKREDDPCAATEMLDCMGLSSSLVKPFIDMALDHKKLVQSLKAATWSNRVSLAGIVISFLALTISFLKFWRTQASRISSDNVGEGL